jgi:tetratricopeptide (TPR) repeat protein
MTLSHDQIDRLLNLRMKDGTILRIQDQMIQEIIKANNWERPIFFAVTVPQENRRVREDHLQMEGMVYRLLPEKRTSAMDMARTRKNLWEVYRYRGMGDSTVYHSEHTRRLLVNLSSAFLSLANHYNLLGQKEEAIAQLEKATQVLTGDWRSHAFLADLYAQSRDYGAAQRQLTKALEYNPELFVLHRMMGSVSYFIGEMDRAQTHYQKALQLNPDSRSVVIELTELYRYQGYIEEARELLRQWLHRHPNDTGAQNMLDHRLGSDKGGNGAASGGL